MKNKKFKILLYAALFLGVIGTANVIGMNKAEAFGLDASQITTSSHPIITDENIKINVPADSVGASFSWDATGHQTQVMNEAGTAPAASNGKTTADQYWAPANTPSTPQPLYSIEPGSTYRLTNTGVTTDGQGIDIIWKVEQLGVLQPNMVSGVSFNSSASLGGASDPFHSIALLVSGTHTIRTNLKYVKAGTNEPINITTGTFWSDIDMMQGVDENQSNTAVIVPPLAQAKLAVNNRTMYSTTLDDANGLNNPDFGAYAGVGTGTNFEMTYYNPYTEGENASKINNIDSWQYFRYDLFGIFNNFEYVPPVSKVTDPQKTVTDVDENKVVDSSTGLTVKAQEYDISVNVGEGSGPSKLVLKDTFPKAFTTDISKIKITGKDGADVTSLFDITLSGQDLTATLKTSELKNANIINTRVNVNVKGTLPEWLGEKFTNKGIWTGDTDLPTNEVSTVKPSEPSVAKTVSTNDKDYTSSSKPEDAALVANRPDDYTWKLDFELSNYTDFTKIQLVDHLETLQTIDPSKVKVFDSTGADITGSGAITTAVNNGKTDVVWTASDEYIKSVNTKYGIKSAEKPKFTMSITTNIKDALNSDESKYYDETIGAVVIPNTGSLIEGDNTGDVSVDSNTSYVKFPKPGESDVKKYVAIDGTDPLKDEGWMQSIELANHDQLYSYKTIFQLSKDFNYDDGKLVLTDKYENIQKYDTVKIIDSTGKDRTSEFKITETKANGDKTTNIAATPIKANDFDDKGETLIMLINGVTWKGATGKQEVEYLEPNTKDGTVFDDKDPFSEGVTIPNTSNLTQTSSIPKYTTNKDTDKTYVNLVINPGVEKSVEADGMDVIDPEQ